MVCLLGWYFLGPPREKERYLCIAGFPSLVGINSLVVSSSDGGVQVWLQLRGATSTGAAVLWFAGGGPRLTGRREISECASPCYFFLASLRGGAPSRLWWAAEAGIKPASEGVVSRRAAFARIGTRAVAMMLFFIPAYHGSQSSRSRLINRVR